MTDAAKIFVIKGEKVALVQGETYNMKITYPYDLKGSRSLCWRTKAMINTIYRLVAPRRFEIAFEDIATFW